MKSLIQSTIHRTRRYWYDDGFAEVAVGLLFMTVGLGLFAQYISSGIWFVIALIATTILAGGSSYLVSKLVNQMKEQVTYPRTGYVEYEQKPDPRLNRLVMVFPILVGVLILFLPETFAVMGSVVGLLVGIILAYIGFSSSVGRFMILAVFAFGSGILSSVFWSEDITSTAFVFISIGLALLVSGGIVLKNYLHQNPLPAEDES